MDCQLCRARDSYAFLDLGLQPLANKYPRAEEFVQEPFHRMEVLFCPRCKNVQLGHVVSRERMFVDYYYLSSVNLGLVRHFEAMAKDLAGARLVVDIGSNDGILLKPLKERGVRCVGVDPSVNVSKIANDAGLPTLTGFFDAAMVARLLAEWGRPDVVVASSIFTHLENPHAFLEDVRALMDDGTRFLIEVEYIGNFLKRVQFERFYFDRVFYYSLTSLRDLCALHGLAVTDVEDIEPHGGSLRVTVRTATAGVEPTTAVARQLAREEAELTPEAFAAFARTSRAHVDAFKRALEDYRAAGVRVAGYGSPARVATICNWAGIGPDLIPFIVDDSPLKQHRHSPGTHIPIVPKQHLDAHGADVLVTFAYEYLDDIRQKTGNGYRYLIPIPPREVA